MQKSLEFLGYSNYKIDIDGNVYNIKTGRILKQRNNGYGYLHVQIYHKSKIKTFKIHRLLGLCFISNPNKLNCINHINGIKTDNRLENLEWCTLSYNIIHSYKNNLKKNKPVLAYTESGSYNKVFERIKYACDLLNVHGSNVILVCKGKLKSAGKFNNEKIIWKYL